MEDTEFIAFISEKLPQWEELNPEEIKKIRDAWNTKKQALQHKTETIIMTANQNPQEFDHANEIDKAFVGFDVAEARLNFLIEQIKEKMNK